MTQILIEIRKKCENRVTEMITNERIACDLTKIKHFPVNKNIKTSLTTK